MMVKERAIFVGVKKDYGNIRSAIKSAGNGDIIVIDPGVYKENVIVNKLIHLRGNTDNPEKGKVVIHGRNDIPLVFDYLPAQKETIYAEGLQFIRNEGSCQKLCLVANSNSNLSVVFNRCRILAGNVQYTIAISRDTYINSVIIAQCYLQRGHAYLSRFDYRHNNYSTMIKTELNASFAIDICKDRPNKIDVVRVPTHGYGPEYGSYYKEVPEHGLKLFFLWRKIKKKIGLK